MCYEIKVMFAYIYVIIMIKSAIAYLQHDMNKYILASERYLPTSYMLVYRQSTVCKSWRRYAVPFCFRRNMSVVSAPPAPVSLLSRDRRQIARFGQRRGGDLRGSKVPTQTKKVIGFGLLFLERGQLRKTKTHQR